MRPKPGDESDLVKVAAFLQKDGLPGADWIMTQKMDGNYSYSDGESEISLFTRGRGGRGGGNKQGDGSAYFGEFAAALPRGIALEGELGLRSGKAHRAKPKWSDGTTILWVFDAPELTGTYAERRAYLESLAPSWNADYVRLVPVLGVASSLAVLDDTLAKAIADGAEGLMLRDPNGPYRFCGEEVGKYTRFMYKYKDVDDAECLVLGTSTSGNRGYACVLPDGTMFNISSIANLPRVAEKGDIITFVCSGYVKNGKPEYATSICFRTDRTWDDICRAAKPAVTGSPAKATKAHKRKACEKVAAGARYVLEFSCLIS